jgi:hypothetical protein
LTWIKATFSELREKQFQGDKEVDRTEMNVCMVTNQDLTPEKEVSFPLNRHFNVFVLPGMLLVVLAVIYATTDTVRSAAVEILLQLASQKVAGIARGVESTAPDAWRKLLSNSPLRRLGPAEIASAC